MCIRKLTKLSIKKIVLNTVSDTGDMKVFRNLNNVKRYFNPIPAHEQNLQKNTDTVTLLGQAVAVKCGLVGRKILANSISTLSISGITSQ